MPLDLAQTLAWSLAQTLLVPIIVIAQDAGFAVMPSADFDEDPDRIVREYDPFAL